MSGRPSTAAEIGPAMSSPRRVARGLNRRQRVHRSVIPRQPGAARRREPGSGFLVSNVERLVGSPGRAKLCVAFARLEHRRVGSARLTGSAPVGRRNTCSADEPVGQHGGGGLPREPWIVASSTSIRLLIFSLPSPGRIPTRGGMQWKSSTPAARGSTSRSGTQRYASVVIEPFRVVRDLLVSIPGISTIVADVIVAETGGDMTRFPSAGHLASWAGTCPGSNESAGRVKSTHTRPGNPYLKDALGAAAMAAAHSQAPTSVPSTAASPPDAGPSRPSWPLSTPCSSPSGTC
jgi:hypothetical protein